MKKRFAYISQVGCQQAGRQQQELVPAMGGIAFRFGAIEFPRAFVSQFLDLN